MNENYSKYLDYARAEIHKQLKNLDQKLFLNKEKRFIVKDFRQKIIWTPHINIITLNRRRYFDKVTKKYVYLLDEHLNIEKYKFVNKQYQKLAIFYFPIFKNYQAIADIIFNKQVSKMSIHNFIKNYQNDLKVNHFNSNSKRLIINADSLWNKKNKSKKSFEIKNLVFFTHRYLDKNTKKWKLANKTLKYFYNESPKQIKDEVQTIIDQYKNIKKIYLIGDGASWIQKLAKEIGAIYFIDKFHYKKQINNLMGKNFPYKAQIYDVLLKKYSHQKMRITLYKLIGNYQSGEISNKQIRIIGYLCNNAKYFWTYKNKKYLTNCIEAMQAHYQAKFFKNQRKGWNINVVQNLINFIYSKQNIGTNSSF